MRTKPHLLVRIKEGWRFDEEAGQFVSDDQRCVPTEAGLPSPARVEYRVPQLAKASRGSLSESEANLLRYFNVMLPPGSDPSDYLKVVKGWPCVEDVQLPPEVGLPDQP